MAHFFYYLPSVVVLLVFSLDIFSTSCITIASVDGKAVDTIGFVFLWLAVCVQNAGGTSTSIVDVDKHLIFVPFCRLETDSAPDLIAGNATLIRAYLHRPPC